MGASCQALLSLIHLFSSRARMLMIRCGRVLNGITACCLWGDGGVKTRSACGLRAVACEVFRLLSPHKHN